MRRRGLLAALPLLLAACGSSPPVQLYRLRTDPPEAAAPPAAGEPIQLLLPVRVPEYLDREAILLPQPGSGLLALGGHRWAESLRDAVPRVLRADLALRLGDGRVWTAPLPPGLKPAQQLRVELLALEAEADAGAVRLQARWTWIDPAGAAPPRAGSARLRVATAGNGIDALVAAHRQALWQLSARITDAR